MVNSVYANHPHFWTTINGQRYGLEEVYELATERYEQLIAATNSVGQIVAKVNQLLPTVDNETFRLLGYPEALWPYLRQGKAPFSAISRCDFSFDDATETFKLLEMNSDTPTFIYETFYMTGQIAARLQRRNPNEASEATLRRAVNNSITGDGRTVFVSFRDDAEDSGTLEYLRSLYEGDSEHVDIRTLRVGSEQLYTEDGRVVDTLYRHTYPLEYLIDDEAEDGTRVGEQVLNLWRDGKLELVHSPNAFLTQSKAVQALIWGLYEERAPLFTEDEHEMIARYFLPTYLDEAVFRGQPYVAKAIYGREGNSVTLYGADGEPLSTRGDDYWHYGKVYQQFCPLPRHGDWSLLFTCFLIEGEATGVGLRAGGAITDNAACFMPIVLS